VIGKANMARDKSNLYEPNLKNAVAKAIREKVPARFSDGNGLTLVVSAAGRAAWIHRYEFRGRWPERTLGTYPKLTLADARGVQREDRALLDRDRNPVEVHANGEHAAVPTFAEFCTAHFKRLAPPSQRHLSPMRASQWYRDMTEVVGHIAKLPVDDVRLTDVEQVVKPMWRGEVAPPKVIRVASAVARVMDFRIALERPNADPDANDWSKTLVKRLRKRVGDVKHHTKHYPALPFDKAPAMFARLKAMPAMSARCLEGIVCTGVRAQEAAGALFKECYWDGTMAGRHTMTWTVPASRRKSHKNKGEAGEPFIIPVSLAMLRCFNRARRNRDDVGPNNLIFPSYGCNLNAPRRKAAGKASTSNRRHKGAGGVTGFSTQGILEVTRMFGDHGTITTHGFRSTMTGWGVAAQHRRLEPFTRELMDRTLGHGTNAKRDGVSAALPAYLREGVEDPFLDRRGEVLREWSAYLNGAAPLVLPGKRAPVPVPVQKPVPKHPPQLRLVA
jgi:hypothetical protein